MDDLKDADIKDFFNVKGSPRPLPKLQAVRVLQALLADPDMVFSAPSMLAYYAVVRELTSVGDNKSYGGARATEGGIPSAFMTGEAARAISGVARSLKNTADTIQSVHDSFLELSLVDKLREDGGEKAYGNWIEIAIRRLSLSAYTAAVVAARRSAVGLGNASLQAIQVGGKPNPQFFMDFVEGFKATADAAVAGIAKAAKRIDDYHKEEDTSSDPLFAARHGLGRGIGKCAVERAGALATQAQDAAAEMRVFLETGNAPTLPALAKFIKSLRRQANEARDLVLGATALYLESVLDREIERATNGPFNAGELACAAASYAYLEKPAVDRRLQCATELLCQSLALDGTYATTSFLDTDQRGYRAVLYGSEVLRALAQLLEKVDLDVEPDVVNRMLSYFESKAKRSDGGTVLGWTSDEPRQPVKAARWISAIAILAVDRMVRMLDKQINRRVGRHFAVRKPKELESKPRLEGLFYSDVGLTATCADYPDSENKKQSIAYFLERMRAHVLGIGKLPGYETPCYSLLLYGPPGTGKTTLVESLAVSSNANYMEITPSDFLVEGEALIERRARHVFQCLSYVTQTVILFDEFDPVIRSRTSEDRKLDLYSFITPGMLPKLKLLHDQAKKRRVAYCLITNRIETLDEAAIRSGRFDYRIGVYPPDLYSRAGQLVHLLAKLEEWAGMDAAKLTRLSRVIGASAGLGMTYLGQPGNYSLPKKGQSPAKGTLLHYILNGPDDPFPSMAEPDARWSEDSAPKTLTVDPKSAEPKAASEHGQRQRVQWKYVHDLDEELLQSPILDGGSDVWSNLCAFLETNAKGPHAKPARTWKPKP